MRTKALCHCSPACAVLSMRFAVDVVCDWPSAFLRCLLYTMSTLLGTFDAGCGYCRILQASQCLCGMGAGGVRACCIAVLVFFLGRCGCASSCACATGFDWQAMPPSLRLPPCQSPAWPTPSVCGFVPCHPVLCTLSPQHQLPTVDFVTLLLGNFVIFAAFNKPGLGIMSLGVL